MKLKILSKTKLTSTVVKQEPHKNIWQQCFRILKNIIDKNMYLKVTMSCQDNCSIESNI